MSDYNGWTNYETWNWKLWIDNDQGWQESVLEAAQDFKGDPYGLSKYLQQDCEEMQELFDLPTSGPFADLLGAAIGSINFYEIADNILEDLE
jgi:hypothetical protein